MISVPSDDVKDEEALLASCQSQWGALSLSTSQQLLFKSRREVLRPSDTY